MKLIKKIKRLFNKIITPMILGIPVYSTKFFRHVCHKNFLQGITYALSKKQKALNKIKNKTIWDNVVNFSIVYSTLCSTKVKNKWVQEAKDFCCYYAFTCCHGQTKEFKAAVIKRIVEAPYFKSLSEDQVKTFISSVTCNHKDLMELLFLKCRI